MAKTAGLSCILFIGGYEIAADVSAIEMMRGSKALLEVPTIDLQAMARLQGLASGEITFNVWFDDEANLEHTILKTLPTTDTIVSIAIDTGSPGNGPGPGDPVAAMVCKQVDYDWVRGADGSLAGTIHCIGSGYPLQWNLLVGGGDNRGSTSHSNNSSHGTGVVDAAQTTAGFVGYLHYLSVASGSVTAWIVQDSSDTSNGIDGSWGTLTTFSTTTVRTAERKTVTGTVEKGIRLHTTGTFSNAVGHMSYYRGTTVDDEDLS
jgi:hypothetical protein